MEDVGWDGEVAEMAYGIFAQRRMDGWMDGSWMCVSVWGGGGYTNLCFVGSVGCCDIGLRMDCRR